MTAGAGRRVLCVLLLTAVPVLLGWPVAGGAYAHGRLCPHRHQHPHTHRPGLPFPLPGGGWVRIILPVRPLPRTAQPTQPGGPTTLPSLPLPTFPWGWSSASPTAPASASPSAGPSASAVPVPLLTPLLAVRPPSASPRHDDDAAVRPAAPVTGPVPLAARPVPSPAGTRTPAGPAGAGSAVPQALRSGASARDLLPLGIGLALIGAGAALIGLRLRRG